MNMILFIKAATAAPGQHDLFTGPVHVDGYVRAGKMVAGYDATRPQRTANKAEAEPAGAPAAAPAAEPPREKRIMFRESPAPGTKHFYVSAIDGPKHHLVAGPYGSHQAALDMVDHVRRNADERDPRAHWMAWGTSGTENPVKTPLGENWRP